MPFAPFPEDSQFVPLTPPFHIRIPGPDEFLTTKSLIVGGPEVPQLDALQNNPA